MIEIRPAQENDVTALSELGRTTFVETFAKENRKEDIDAYVCETFGVSQQRAEISDPNRIIEIAWIDGEAAGFLHLRKGKPDPSVTGPKPIEILRLYVDSRWHGKGAGQALMDRAIEIALREGFEALWLGVWERNFRAQTFYGKYGFKVVGSHAFRLGSDEQTDLIMARPIFSPI